MNNTYVQSLPLSDQKAIALILVGAPHLRYKAKGGRDDGFISRPHKGAYIYRNLSIRRKWYASGREYFEVESISKQLAPYHRVELDLEDGQHLCTCPDGTYNHYCAHIFAVLFRVADETVTAWNDTPQESMEPLANWQVAGAKYGDYSDGTKSLLDLEAEIEAAYGY